MALHPRHAGKTRKTDWADLMQFWVTQPLVESCPLLFLAMISFSSKTLASLPPAAPLQCQR